MAMMETAVAGTAELAALAEKVLAPNYGKRIGADIAFTSGRGPWLFTPEGEKYLDFLAGIAVCCLGYAHPRVTKAIQDQAGRLLHTSNLFLMEPQIRLAQLLVDHSFGDQAFFCNSGAEANEAALKLAKKIAQDRGENHRYEVVSLQESFHGRTIATLSATGQTKLHEGFRPLLPGFNYLPINDIQAPQDLITEKTCAVIIEPIQGEAGVRPVADEYLRLLRDLCTERGAMLILDEVQTGMGRTGRFFAYEHSGIEPDIVTMAKGLGNGVPIGAMLAKREVMQHLTAGSHGSTFGGNALVCAAAAATLETLFDEHLLDAVNDLSDALFAGLRRIKKHHPRRVKEIRGRGLMVGVELDNAAPVHLALLQRRVITNCIRGKTLRLLPPFIITHAEIDLFLTEFEAALGETGS
jgi:predicted acetylornithine/succinylornithine family transaminase